ncbi:MAG: DUF6483 family protein [Lachnospiraceae bacterium]|nr:DUF6483 family protein [Lachnospiraceae bacterium]
MFENDYIMRLITEMVRALLRLLFHTDIDSLAIEIVKDNEVKSTVTDLLDLLDDGQINEAENKLSDILDADNQETLKAALLFYSHLNEKSNDFLESHNYSREEIKMGLTDTAELFGVGSIADVFIN